MHTVLYVFFLIIKFFKICQYFYDRTFFTLLYFFLCFTFSFTRSKNFIKNNFLNTHFSFLRYLTHFTLFSHTFAFFIFLSKSTYLITHQQIFVVFEILHML